MEVLINLFSQYSIESIIIFIMAIAVAFKAISELWEYFYDKLRKYFNYQTSKEQSHKEVIEGIEQLKKEIVLLKKEEITLLNKKVDESIEKSNDLKNQMALVTERLQESSRSHIIDRHHYFCYEIGHIDDLSLQSLEREYLYYKAAGGDTYIDSLMEGLRALPRLTSYGVKNIEKNEIDRKE